MPGVGTSQPQPLCPPIPGLRRAGLPYSYEYKSQKTIFGMPLVHIVYGPAWAGGLKPARGFIAIGNIAIGVVAIGGFALGLFTLAGIGLGFICIAGIALGIGAGVGGIATGYYALGGLAIGVYAIGGLRIGTHTLTNDPHLLESLTKSLPTRLSVPGVDLFPGMIRNTWCPFGTGRKSYTLRDERGTGGGDTFN